MSLPFTQDFLEDWPVKLRLSFTAYSQSGRPHHQGSKENSKWQHRTPRVFRQWLCSKSYPPIQEYAHPEHRAIPYSTITPLLAVWLHTIPNILYKLHAKWIATVHNREISLSQRNACLVEWYNCTAHSLCPLQNEQTISIQCQSTHQWDTTGQIIETLSNHIFWIRVDWSGRIILQNCRFLRKIEASAISLPIPCAFPEPSTPIPGGYQEPNALVLQTMDSGTRLLAHPLSSGHHSATYTDASENHLGIVQITPTQPNFKEFIPHQRPLPRCNGGGGDVE